MLEREGAPRGEGLRGEGLGGERLGARRVLEGQDSERGGAEMLKSK